MEEVAHRRGLRSSVRNFRSFPAPACISVNDVFVNGLPTQEPIAVGDLVNVQFGVTDGLAYAHQAWAYSVGEPTAEQRQLLDAGVEALASASRVARGDGCVGDISQAIQNAADAHGCKPSRHFVGCGIWEQPFEPPQIPCYMPSEHAAVPLQPGMVLLVQAILHAGLPEAEVLEDQWSVRSKDGRPAVTMSRMLLVNEDSARPLTELRNTILTSTSRRNNEVA
jgi:methionyl aminopeptidase